MIFNLKVSVKLNQNACPSCLSLLTSAIGVGFFAGRRLNLVLAIQMLVLALTEAQTAVSSISAMDKLTCSSQSCKCFATNASVIYCNIMGKVFRIPEDVSEDIRHVGIYGHYFSLDIPDQNYVYKESWSAIESLKIEEGRENNDRFKFPYNFGKVLLKAIKLVIRNTGLASIEQSAFANMVSLKYLDLSDNKNLAVEHIKPGFEAYTHNNLETLILRNIRTSNGNRLSL